MSSSNNIIRTGSEIVPISIKKEMESSYLDYAMSVIVSRAIPDVRDGLKPVHRRIIYAMNDAGVHSNKPYRKSARIVGDVMGKYHPHGDTAIYDALVRMAQNFSMRLPLVDGQGNFGSMDGDSPAAMRYTESRMAKSAHALIADIEKETVEWQDNYDGSEKEPLVLPARYPNLLVNGSSGIAVGMATNIPPHNLGEVIDATIYLIDKPEATVEELTEIVPAPDFPTGGIILGRSTAVSALQTGRGSVVTRGRAEIVENGNRQQIIITEIPYMVNKAVMVEKMAELIREKKVEGVSDLRDESDKQGVRVVLDLKKDANGSVILNQLYKFTPLQSSFGVNMLALDYGRPRQLNLLDVLTSFIRFRKEVVTRRTKYDLGKARERAHILIGLSMAVANIDEVIQIIRSSPDAATARERLMNRDWNAADVIPLIKLVEDEQNIIVNDRCKFTDAQARAILEMRLARLTGLEQEKLQGELKEVAVTIEDLLGILGDYSRMMEIIKTELKEVKEQFATPRRTEIQQMGLNEDIEDLIAREDMVVTVTMGGYIKRVSLATYRAQKRGGKGRTGLELKDEDATTQVFVASTHTPMLFFSTKGKCYKLKTYMIPLATPQSKGRSLVNLLPLDGTETINVIMPLPEDQEEANKLHIIFATKQGNIRRNELSDFESVRSNGKIAIKLDEGDELIGVLVADETKHMMLATKQGKALRCPVTAVRVFKGRDSSGVRGVTLEEGDSVISLAIINGSETDAAARDAYTNISLEKRMEIAKILPSSYSPQTELVQEVELKAGEKFTLELLNNSGNAEIAERITKILEGIELQGLTIDKVIEFACEEEFILTITENGYGKRTSSFEYRTTNRGGKGVGNIITSERNGLVAACFPCNDNNQLMLVTNSGKLIRCPVDDIRVAGRNTQGVTIFRIDDNEKIVSAARIASVETTEEVTEAIEESEAEKTESVGQ